MMSNFVTDDQTQLALDYLRDSAEPFAEWKANMKWLEHRRKVVRAVAVLEQKAGSHAANLAIADASIEYSDVLGEYKDAVYHFTLIESRRKAAELKIEVWRSLNANNRKGNL